MQKTCPYYIELRPLRSFVFLLLSAPQTPERVLEALNS